MEYKLTQQQFKNLTEAVNFWLKVPQDTVTERLNAWRKGQSTTGTPSCGSTACFGGWLPYSPYFSHLGVQARSRYEGHPVLRVNDVPQHEGKDLSEYLFGESELFASRQFWDKDRDFIRELGPHASDWGLVLMRLAYVIDNADLINDPV